MPALVLAIVVLAIAVLAIIEACSLVAVRLRVDGARSVAWGGGELALTP